jgi:hypothetical protein
MEKFIHIHAKCKAFEIFELMPEKKAVKRLVNIKKNFINLKNRIQFSDDSLVVKTIVVNPEFNFSYL